MDLPNSSSTISSIDAIDFQRLYKDEERKAREQRRREKTTTIEASKNDTNSRHEPTTNPSVKRLGGLTTFPPWSELPNMTVPPRLDRAKDCLTKKYRSGYPASIYYKPHYLANGADYQQALLQWLDRLPENTTTNNEWEANGKWTRLPHAQRRVALFDGRLLARQQQQLLVGQQRKCEQDDASNHQTSSSSSSSSSEVFDDGDGCCWFPPPLQQLVDWIVASQIFSSDAPPNHILINDYAEPVSGILPHTDGPAYDPRTATISLGCGSVLLHFTPILQHRLHHPNNDNNDGDGKSSSRSVQVLLHGLGSLVVFEGMAYADYRHSIDELVGSSTTVEHAGDHCLNAEPGTAVIRDSHRISITIRRKK
jgi:hypothetical protein